MWPAISRGHTRWRTQTSSETSAWRQWNGSLLTCMSTRRRGRTARRKKRRLDQLPRRLVRLRGDGEAGQRAAMLLQSSQKAWKIPTRVPRGYEIQIAIITTGTEAEKGHFRRLGLDVVVNATWLAMKWALDSKDSDAEVALTALILDWPFDFILFEGEGTVVDGADHEAHHQYARVDRTSA